MLGRKSNKRRGRQGARGGKTNSTRSKSTPPGTWRRDVNGRTYGGSIVSLTLNKNQEFSRKPARPLGEADYSTCQMVNSIAIETGLTAGSATQLPTIQATVNATTPFAMAFSLQDLNQVASLTALFDQYRFDKVELKLIPQSTSINVMNTASPNDTPPKILAVLDFDDSIAPASLAAVQEYDNVQIVTYGEGLMITLLPSYTPAVFAAGAFSGYAVQRAGWLDCANQAVAHYGIKGIVTALQALSTSGVYWDVAAKYYVSFRNTR